MSTVRSLREVALEKPKGVPSTSPQFLTSSVQKLLGFALPKMVGGSEGGGHCLMAGETLATGTLRGEDVADFRGTDEVGEATDGGFPAVGLDAGGIIWF